MDCRSDKAEPAMAGCAPQIPDFAPDQLLDLAQVLPAAQVGALANSYHAAVEACLDQLDAAAAAMDGATLREQAHDLKSVAGNFGAHRLQHMAGTLEAAYAESAAVAPQAADIRALVAAMHDAASAAWISIRQHLDAPVAVAVGG